MPVTVSGMFGSGKTYFSDSPVVIDISGLEWGASTPFTVVGIEVLYGSAVAGAFRFDTGHQTSVSVDISTALRAIWSGADFSSEVAAAGSAASNKVSMSTTRPMRGYSLKVYTEYLDSHDGKFTRTECGTFQGGRCLIGGMTALERSRVPSKEAADVSYLNHSNARYGDASTKPSSSPERVGRDSITSWVDVDGNGTVSSFYPSSQVPSADGWDGHAPLVLRDTFPYTDFLFVNRRGAVEACCAPAMEAMSVEVEARRYARIERPAFIPSRSLMAIAGGGLRSWQMSSGHQTREWADWWACEFLAARRHWMLYEGRYVPVVVEPARKGTGIYDRARQQAPHVDFTVTLALEG